MMRPWLLGGVLACVLCAHAHAQAQIEIVTVTASFVGPRAEKFLTAARRRLTPEGKALVEQDAERIYNGAIDVAAAQTEAEDNCAKAFESCGSADVHALTALILEGSLWSAHPDVEKLASGIPEQQSIHTAEQMQACQVRNDLKCARKVFLASLPADRRKAFNDFARYVGKIRAALNQVLASAGYDQKDDR
jgi:hypothetical protein